MNCLHMLFQQLSCEVLTPHYTIDLIFSSLKDFFFPTPKVAVHSICADLAAQKAGFHYYYLNSCLKDPKDMTRADVIFGKEIHLHKKKRINKIWHAPEPVQMLVITLALFRMRKYIF